jgi:hemerythrin-like domain-containing protein
MTDTPDLTTYRLLHRAMRRSNDQLVAAIDGLADADADRAAALGRWFTGYAGELRCHHHIEDDILFPALAARVPTYAEYGGSLAADHERLDEVIDSVAAAIERRDRGAALAAAVELRHLLAEHLGVEDDDILPLFERHFSAAEWDTFDKAAEKAIKPKQLLFTLPWLASTLDDRELAAILDGAPLVLRVLWRVSKGRYAKLAAVAFGPVAGAAARSR